MRQVLLAKHLDIRLGRATLRMRLTKGLGVAPWWAVAVIGALFFVLILGEGRDWGGGTGLTWRTDACATLASLVALGACLHTARRTGGSDRRVWLLFAMGCCVWLVGQLAWDYYDLRPPFPSSPTLADLDLVFVPAVMAGLLAIGSGSSRSRALLALDAAVLTIAFAILFITLFWGDLMQSRFSLAAQVTALLYPCLYGTLAVSVLLVPMRGLWRQRSFPLLLLGVLMEVVPCILWAPQLLRGTFSAGTYLDLFWTAGMLLIAASAVTFEAFPEVEAERQVHGPVAQLPLALAAGSALVIVWHFITMDMSRAMDQLLVGLIAAIVVLTATRLALTIDSSRRLYDSERGALLVSEGSYHGLLQTAEEGVGVIDADGFTTFANHKLAKMLGYPIEEIIGKPFYAFLDDEMRAVTEADLERRRQGISEQVEIRLQRKDGTPIWTFISSSPRHDDQGRSCGALAMLTDITKRKQAEEMLRSSEERYRTLVQTSPDAIALVDLDAQIVLANHQAASLFGFVGPDALTGVNLLHLFTPDEAVRASKDLTRVIETGGVHNQEYTAWHPDGTGRPLEVSASLIRDKDGAPEAIMVVGSDISAHKQLETQLRHQALHDGLTGLPNRMLLEDRLHQAILAIHRDRTCLALLFLDLDRFKEVNDTFGHLVGDGVLREMGQRLQSALREGDTVARLGGDEFAVLSPLADAEGAALLAHRLLNALTEPFIYEGQAIDVDASIGIALCPEHGGDAATLLRRADVAMYEAKRLQSGHLVYNLRDDVHTPDRIALVSDLRSAIVHNEMRVHYQPKLHLATGVIREVEALARWEHPQRGFIAPAQFIPLAEQTGLIRPLTVRVLSEALRQCRAWQADGVHLSVAVNLSAHSLHDASLVPTVAALLTRYDVAPERLVLEITESMLALDPEQAMEMLGELDTMGVQLSIDDFGTGYSSLASLTRLPVDEVKIDQSFVGDMMGNARNALIVRSVIDLGHNLGLQVVAEGVEDDETYQALVDMGCDALQGYVIGRPLPAAEVVHLLSRKSA